MKNLQREYQLIKEGKGNKNFFLSQARRLFPDLVTQYNSYDDTIRILRGKRILNEATETIVKTAPTDETFTTEFKKNIIDKEVLDVQAHAFNLKNLDNIDNLNGNSLLTGFIAEMYIKENKEKTVAEIIDIVAKNLKKDPLHYVKDGQFGEKGVGYVESPKTKETKGKYKSSGAEEVTLKESKKSLRENKLPKSLKDLFEDHNPKIIPFELFVAIYQDVEKVNKQAAKDLSQYEIKYKSSNKFPIKDLVNILKKYDLIHILHNWGIFNKGIFNDDILEAEDPIIYNPEKGDEVHLDVMKQFGGEYTIYVLFNLTKNASIKPEFDNKKDLLDFIKKKGLVLKNPKKLEVKESLSSLYDLDPPSNKKEYEYYEMKFEGDSEKDYDEKVERMLKHDWEIIKNNVNTKTSVSGRHKYYYGKILWKREKNLNEEDINSPMMMKLRAEKDKPLKSNKSNKEKDIIYFKLIEKISKLEDELDPLLKLRKELQLNIENVADPVSGDLNDDGELLNLDQQIKKIVDSLNKIFDQGTQYGIDFSPNKEGLKNQLLDITNVIGSEILESHLEESKFDIKNISDVKFMGIDKKDHPDYVDSYVVSAKLNGEEMTEEEIEELNNDSELKYELLMDYLH